MIGSHHMSGAAMDFKVSTATPEEAAEQSAAYAVFAERLGGAKPKVQVLRGTDSYRLDVWPEPVARVLWGGRSLLDRLRGRRWVQIGSALDLELTRRDRERAAFARRVAELRSPRHGHHVHVALGALGQAADAAWKGGAR